MPILALDLGGTKLAAAMFSETGEVISREISPLDGRMGKEVGAFITETVLKFLARKDGLEIKAIGICIPGIARQKSGTVWAPNIQGWDDYPLLAELKAAAGDIPVVFDSDRACYILGEHWLGKARNCTDAIYLAVGTGIGAGILINGEVLRGAEDIAGAIGWMALKPPYHDRYTECGYFEYYASGEGIARVARHLLEEQSEYIGELSKLKPSELRAHHIFTAYKAGDVVAGQVVSQAITFWGMAIANLISLFNPQMIILGGGVFGPASALLPQVREEALKWAQPISGAQTIIETSGLDTDAGLYGAGFLALKNVYSLKSRSDV